jgi:hypothetical protein
MGSFRSTRDSGCKRLVSRMFAGTRNWHGTLATRSRIGARLGSIGIARSLVFVVIAVGRGFSGGHPRLLPEKTDQRHKN